MPVSDFFELNSWALTASASRLHAAAAFNHSAEALLTHSRPHIWPYRLVDPFHLFACAATPVGHRDSARRAIAIMLSQGSRLDAVDASSWTPLSYAAWFGLSSTLDLLLEAGAQVHPAEGAMPLAVALSSLAQRQNQGSATCARLLLMSGADPLRCSISDAAGRSSYLSWALSSANMEWANLLYAKGDVIRCERELATLVWQADAESLDWLQVHGYEVLGRLPHDHPHREVLAQAHASRRRTALGALAGISSSDALEEDPRKI